MTGSGLCRHSYMCPDTGLLAGPGCIYQLDSLVCKPVWSPVCCLLLLQFKDLAHSRQLSMPVACI